jgi:hypothetical protein
MSSFPGQYIEQGSYPNASFIFTPVTPSPVQTSDHYGLETSSLKQSSLLEEPTLPAIVVPDHTTLSVKPLLCPLCKGKKYGFTAYLHNTKIFSEPPHELLALIEKSYILKNRLKSLLITYVMRELEQCDFEEAEKGILRWAQMIEELAQEVRTVMGSEPGVTALDEARNWTMKKTEQIRDHVGGRQKMDIPKGRLNALLLELRKLWETVWKQCSLRRKVSQPEQDVAVHGVAADQ